MADGAPITSSAFAAADFDAVRWINDRIKPGDAAAVDTQVASTIVHLQLLSQECGDRVDAHMARVSSSLPRAKRDIKHLAADVGVVGQAVRKIAKPAEAAADAAGAAAGSNAHIRRLEQLDRVKTRMEAVRDLLNQATAWDRMMRATEDVFASRSVPRAQAHVTSLRSCAHTLRHMPDAEIRAIVVRNAEQQLEQALLLPLLRKSVYLGDGARVARLLQALAELDAASATGSSITSGSVAASTHVDVAHRAAWAPFTGGVMGVAAATATEANVCQSLLRGARVIAAVLAEPLVRARAHFAATVSGSASGSAWSPCATLSSADGTPLPQQGPLAAAVAAARSLRAAAADATTDASGESAAVAWLQQYNVAACALVQATAAAFANSFDGACDTVIGSAAAAAPMAPAVVAEPAPTDAALRAYLSRMLLLRLLSRVTYLCFAVAAPTGATSAGRRATTPKQPTSIAGVNLPPSLLQELWPSSSGVTATQLLARHPIVSFACGATTDADTLAADLGVGLLSSRDTAQAASSSLAIDRPVHSSGLIDELDVDDLSPGVAAGDDEGTDAATADGRAAYSMAHLHTMQWSWPSAVVAGAASAKQLVADQYSDKAAKELESMALGYVDAAVAAACGSGSGRGVSGLERTPASSLQDMRAAATAFGHAADAADKLLPVLQAAGCSSGTAPASSTALSSHLQPACFATVIVALAALAAPYKRQWLAAPVAFASSLRTLTARFHDGKSELSALVSATTTALPCSLIDSEAVTSSVTGLEAVAVLSAMGRGIAAAGCSRGDNSTVRFQLLNANGAPLDATAAASDGPRSPAVRSMLSIGPVASAGAALPPPAATGKSASAGTAKSAVVPLVPRVQPLSGSPAIVGASGSPAAGSPAAESSAPHPPPPSLLLVQQPHASLLLSLLAHPDALPVASLGGAAPGRGAGGAGGGIVAIGARVVHGTVPLWLQGLVFTGAATASTPGGNTAGLPSVAAAAWRQWRDAVDQADALNALAAETADACGSFVTLRTAANRVALQQQEVMLRAAVAFHDTSLAAFMPRQAAADSAVGGASAAAAGANGGRKRDWMDDDETGAAGAAVGGGAPAVSIAAAAKPLSPHDILATGRAVALHAATAVACAQAAVTGYQATLATRTPLVEAFVAASASATADHTGGLGTHDWARLLLEPAATAAATETDAEHRSPLLLAAVVGTLAEMRAAGGAAGDAATRVSVPQRLPAYAAGSDLAFAAALRATFDALLAPVVAACRGLRGNAAVWATVSADGDLPSPFDVSDIEAAATAAAPAGGGSAAAPGTSAPSASSTAEYDEEEALALQAAAYGATGASPAATKGGAAGGHVRDVLLGAAGAGRSPTATHASASGSFSFSVPPSPYAAAVSEHLVAIAHQLAPPLHPLVAAVRGAGDASSASSDISRTLAWHALLSALEMPHLGDVERSHVYTAVAGLPQPPAADADTSGAAATSPALAAAVAALGIVPPAAASPTSGSGSPPPATDAARAVETLAGEAGGVARAATAGSVPADTLLASAHAIATAEASLWLQAVVRACCCLLLYELMRIPRLECGGVRQLVADYEHVAAVFSALQVRPDPLLQWFIALARMPARQLAKLAPAHLQALAKVAELPPAPAEALVSLHKMVARMRGAPVTL